MAEETVLLKVQLDEGATKQRLATLVLDIERTKDAQKELTAARKAGEVTEAQFAATTVRLGQTMREQRTEQTALTKNLDLYTRAVNGVAGSYDQSQAQLSLAQKQFQQLAGSAENSTEETQALAGVIDGLRNNLKTTDGQMSLFVRNVGNYSGAVEPLIAELKRLELQQSALAKESPEYAAAQTQIVGFQQQINRVSAEAGNSYEQTQAKLKGYGDTIAPVVAELVRLENEQAKVAEGSEGYARIGFQIAGAKKEVEALAEASEASTTAAAGGISFLEENTGQLGQTVGGLRNAWIQASQGVQIARASFVGLKGAIAATGIGLFILTLVALVEYFRSTDEGAEDLAAGLAFLKGGFSVLQGVAIAVGKVLVGLFKEPKKTAGELVDFLATNVTNRIKAFGVLLDAVLNGDTGKLKDGLIQLTTGIENGTAKARAFGNEIARAASVARELSRASDALDDARRAEVVTLEENKNLIEKLLLSAKDRSLTEAERLANLDKAGKLETANLTTTTRLAAEKLRILVATNAEASKTGKISDEQRDAATQAEAEVVRLAGQSATLLQGIANRRSVLLEKEAAEDSAALKKRQEAGAKAAEARLVALQTELKARAGFLELELAEVATGTEQELNLLRRKLATARELELTAAGLSVRERALIEAKYRADSAALTDDFARKQLATELGNAQALLNAQLANLKEGSAEALALQQQLVNSQLAAELAALDTRTDNKAKVAELEARAAQQRSDNELAQNLANLENYFSAERARVNAEYAQGLLTKQQQEDSFLAIERAGAEARLVVAQDYGRSTVALTAELADKDAAARDKRTADDAAALEKRQGYENARLATAGAVTDGIIQLAGEETAAGKVALALKKTFALAEIAINLSREISAIGTAAAANPLNIPTAGIAGITQASILTALAVGKAALLAARVLMFRAGGVVQASGGMVANGPSHENGGIQLYNRRTGRHAGIEIEGGEPVLTAAVSRNPTLLALASAINVAAGGRALVPGRYMALGGVAQLPGSFAAAVAPVAGLVNYEAMGEATAAALRKSPPRVVVSDVQAGLARAEVTDSMANS